MKSMRKMSIFLCAAMLFGLINFGAVSAAEQDLNYSEDMSGYGGGHPTIFSQHFPGWNEGAYWNTAAYNDAKYGKGLQMGTAAVVEKTFDTPITSGRVIIGTDVKILNTTDYSPPGFLGVLMSSYELTTSSTTAISSSNRNSLPQAYRVRVASDEVAAGMTANGGFATAFDDEKAASLSSTDWNHIETLVDFENGTQSLYCNGKFVNTSMLSDTIKTGGIKAVLISANSLKSATDNKGVVVDNFKVKTYDNNFAVEKTSVNASEKSLSLKFNSVLDGNLTSDKIKAGISASKVGGSALTVSAVEKTDTDEIKVVFSDNLDANDEYVINLDESIKDQFGRVLADNEVVFVNVQYSFVSTGKMSENFDAAGLTGGYGPKSNWDANNPDNPSKLTFPTNNWECVASYDATNGYGYYDYVTHNDGKAISVSHSNLSGVVTDNSTIFNNILFYSGMQNVAGTSGKVVVDHDIYLSSQTVNDVKAQRDSHLKMRLRLSANNKITDANEINFNQWVSNKIVIGWNGNNIIELFDMEQDKWFNFKVVIDYTTQKVTFIKIQDGKTEEKEITLEQMDLLPKYGNLAQIQYFSYNSGPAYFALDNVSVENFVKALRVAQVRLIDKNNKEVFPGNNVSPEIKSIDIKFDSASAINAETLANNITLNGTAVSGTYSQDTNILSIPCNYFKGSTDYTIKIGKDVADTKGQKIGNDVEYGFKTSQGVFDTSNLKFVDENGNEIADLSSYSNAENEKKIYIKGSIINTIGNEYIAIVLGAYADNKLTFADIAEISDAACKIDLNQVFTINPNVQIQSLKGFLWQNANTAKPLGNMIKLPK